MGTGFAQYDPVEQLPPDSGAQKEKSTPPPWWLKSLYVGTNFVLGIIVPVLITVGFFFLRDIRDSGLQSLQLLSPLKNAAILSITIGSVILVIGIIACVGVHIKHRFMILLLTIVVACLMALEIAACIQAWYYRKGPALESQLSALIRRVIGQTASGQTSYDSKFDWNFDRNLLSNMEYSLHCCGANGAMDYIVIQATVTTSCYQSNNYGKLFLSRQGCVEALQNFVTNYSLAIGLLCIFAFLLQVILLILTFTIVVGFPQKQSQSKQAPKKETAFQGRESSIV